MKHFLIIGHGFIGSALAADLIKQGHSVTAVNRNEAESKDYDILAGDVSDLDSVRHLSEQLQQDPGAIIHCASSGRGGADAYRAVFLDGTQHLQATFPEVPILFTSSTSVYGQTDGSIVTESSPTTPDRETSRILVEAEQLITAGGGIVLRLAGIYGPGRSIYLKRILDGTATIESGEVSRFINQIHQTDAAGAIRYLIAGDAAAHRGAIYNATDDSPMTQRDCYERLAAYFGVPVPPESAPDTTRKRAWTNKIVSNTALRQAGWEPEYPSFIGALSADPTLIPSMQAVINESPS